MIIEPDDLFRFWTPDAVAECLSVSDETYRALWHIVANQPPREFCETPDAEWSRYALIRTWDQLDPTAQADCNRAAAKHMEGIRAADAYNLNTEN
jgi:hypothetical protein